MRATPKDRARLDEEIERLVEQLADLGAKRVILFGSLARGRVSLFSDIDLLVVFEGDRPARELTRWVYRNILSREAVDIFAFSENAIRYESGRPLIRRALAEGRVVYERGKN